MNPVATSQQRLHDLDALRAAAMRLGIFYHVSLSFALGFPWMVQDVNQDTGAFVFQAWVHGFRMPLFMLISAAVPKLPSTTVYRSNCSPVQPEIFFNSE